MFARFSKTRDLVYHTARGLTPIQLQYRPDANRWSVAENLEHITIVEQHILAGLTRTLQKPPDPAKKSAMTDEQLLANFGRVIQPITAPETLRPTSRWPLSNLLTEFDAARQRTIAFANTAADTKELRYYFMAASLVRRTRLLPMVHPRRRPLRAPLQSVRRHKGVRRLSLLAIRSRGAHTFSNGPGLP